MRMPVRCVLAAAIALPTFLMQPKLVVAAEKMAAPVIMVIDVQKVVNDAKSTKAILAQREKFEQAYRQEFQAEEGKLAEEKKQLDDQRTILSPEAFAEKQKAFNAKAGDYTRRAQIRFANLNEATNNAMGQVASHLNKILREMSGEMGVNLVLNRNQVEYYEPSMDKTQIASDRLNSTMKEVTFLDPVKMGEAQAKARAEAAKAAKDKDAKKK